MASAFANKFIPKNENTNRDTRTAITMSLPLNVCSTFGVMVSYLGWSIVVYI
jgi:hypothetical protein